MKLFDIKIAAEMLAVSPWTIRLYIRKGKLRPVRIGRLVRIQERELERFISEASGEVDVTREDEHPRQEDTSRPNAQERER